MCKRFLPIRTLSVGSYHHFYLFDMQLKQIARDAL